LAAPAPRSRPIGGGAIARADISVALAGAELKAQNEHRASAQRSTERRSSASYADALINGAIAA